MMSFLSKISPLLASLIFDETSEGEQILPNAYAMSTLGEFTHLGSIDEADFTSHAR
jgi:hypothetical protein